MTFRHEHLAQVVDDQYRGQLVRFAEDVGAGRVTTWRWVAGLSVPSAEHMARICLATGETFMSFWEDDH